MSGKRLKSLPTSIGILPIRRLCWVLPCLLALILYARATTFDFLFDDKTLIVLNPQVQSWDYLARLLTTHLWSHRAHETIIPQYRPTFSMWLLAMYTMGGLNKWFWHLSSVLLHTAATYLVFLVTLEILQNPVERCGRSSSRASSCNTGTPASPRCAGMRSIPPLRMILPPDFFRLLAASSAALLFAAHPIHIEPVSW